MTVRPAPKTSSLREIPSVDQLLRTEAAMQLGQLVGHDRLVAVARGVIEKLRRGVNSDGPNQTNREALLTEAAARLHAALQAESFASLRRVINATGVILHTNLGRAPLSEAAKTAVAKEAAGYCTLEYDAMTGKRGKRARRVEELLVQLTGAEDALVVNNCAAAALLILTTLAREGETVVSRGELVEIGGDFRVPDVMANSGTRMVEVGSTNKTRLEDYQRALNNSTCVLMRVHQSNFRIVGFTDAPALSELARLAHENDCVLYEDAGSGVLANLSDYGLGDEPIIRESLNAGADVVSFSGDKLLGASQAGLIVGRRAIIERLRKHSLYRALRADKLCLAALEATLESHRRSAVAEIPALRMLSFTALELEERALGVIEELRTRAPGISASILAGESAIGGGCGPNTHPATSLIALKHEELSATELEAKLRLNVPPVIARVAGEQVLLDLRTVDPSEEPELIAALSNL